MSRVRSSIRALRGAPLAFAATAALVGSSCCLARYGVAAVVTEGNVTPTPPATGGNVAAPFRVGNTGTGSIRVGAGTPVNVTGGNAIFGDAATGVGIATLTAAGSNLTTSGSLIVGNAGVGTISTTGMAAVLVSDDALLGVAANSTGDLFVQDLGSLLQVSDKLVIGDAGNSLVQITNGGRATAASSIIGQAAGSDGRLTVSGRLSKIQQSGAMILGDAGRGEVQIAAQGLAQSGNLLVGNSSAGVGLAVVSGGASSWDVAGMMTLGVGGLGTLNVIDGAQMNVTGAVRLANLAGSEAHMIVSGSTSTFTANGSFRVGENGPGTLDVRLGARVTTGNAILGDNLRARGDVLVDGLGSVWKINGSLDVSEPGEAQLAVTGGGLVSVTGAMRIAAGGRLIMNSARLEVGSTLANEGSIQGTGRIVGPVSNSDTGRIRVTTGNSLLLVNNLVNSANVEVSGGELDVQGGVLNTGVIDARTAILRFGGMGLENNANSQLAMTGGVVDVFGAVTNKDDAQILVGADTKAVFHGTLTNNGDFFITQGAEVLVVNDLSFAPSSLLNFTLGSDDDVPQHAQLDAGGAATLAGGLSVSLAADYQPVVGDAFQVLTAAQGLTGTFTTEALPFLGAGRMWNLDYNDDNLTLSVIAGLSADFNSDGTVNAADLAVWRNAFGATDDAAGDADNDGDADGNDFLVWQRELGASTAGGAASATAAVPEPSAALLAASGLVAGAGVRSRRRLNF